MANNNKAEFIIALSFGRASKKSKYDPNLAIAKIAGSFSLPVLAQKEVAHYLKVVSGELDKPDGYTDTWEALRRAVNISTKRGWSSAILIVHPFHKERAEKQAVKAGLKINATQVPARQTDYTSEQWWTRRKVFWLVHEFFAAPYLKGVRKL